MSNDYYGEHMNIKPAVHERELHEKIQKEKLRLAKELIEALEKLDTTSDDTKQEYPAIYNAQVVEICREHLKKWKNILESNK